MPQSLGQMFFRQDNKKKKFEEIYDRSVKEIYRFIFLKVSSQEVAEDLTSETFTRIWKSLQAEENIENPRAFAFRIARNLVIDHYRRKEFLKVTTPDKIDVSDTEKRADERAEITSEMERVGEALRKLSEDYQNIVIWYYLDELSISEIADLLAKSETTVRVSIHRALKALKKELKE